MWRAMFSFYYLLIASALATRAWAAAAAAAPFYYLLIASPVLEAMNAAAARLPPLSTIS